MSNAEAKAEQLIQQGDRCLKKFSIFSSSNKYEDACDNYEKAANQYKIAKKWDDAGEAFLKCADCQLRLSDSSRAAQYYQSAGDCISKGNSADAIQAYEKAISIYCDNGRFSNAAKLQKALGEIYEQNDNIREAISSYKQASDYFQSENQNSSANTVLIKVAELTAKLEDYVTAAELYEQIAKTCMESNLLKFNAKNHLLNAGVCVLANKDIVLMKQKWESYIEIDYTFEESREGKFLKDMITAYEMFNIDAFADAVYQYDSISKLDAWKVSVLLHVKESITGTAHEADDLT